VRLARGVDGDLLGAGPGRVEHADRLTVDEADPRGQPLPVEPDPQVEEVALQLRSEDVVRAHQVRGGNAHDDLVLVLVSRLQGNGEPDHEVRPGRGRLVNADELTAEDDLGRRARRPLVQAAGDVDGDGHVRHAGLHGDDPPVLVGLWRLAVQLQPGPELIEVPPLAGAQRPPSDPGEFLRHLLREERLGLLVDAAQAGAG
jgi:hypothetical protein